MLWSSVSCVLVICSLCFCANLYVVLSPDQIFQARPVALSKNRVCTLSLWKLGQVYIKLSVIMALSVILPAALVLEPKNLQAGYLWWHLYLIYFSEQCDWWDNMLIHLYDDHVQTLFSTRPQGAWKIWCLRMRLILIVCDWIFTFLVFFFLLFFKYTYVLVCAI